jgi:hypothetical protein
MVLSEMGTLAEILASAATLVTLIYLALQIRTANKAMRSQSKEAMGSAQQPVWLAILENEKLSELYASGLAAADQLRGLEQMRFDILLSQLLNGFERLHYNAEHGLAESSHLEEMHITMRRFLDTPGGRAWWQEFNMEYPATFREYVNRKVYN